MLKLVTKYVTNRHILCPLCQHHIYAISTCLCIDIYVQTISLFVKSIFCIYVKLDSYAKTAFTHFWTPMGYYASPLPELHLEPQPL
jgi:hypothetical protein